MRARFVVVGLVAGALALAPAAQAQALFNYFAKDTGSGFVSPSGKPLGNVKVKVGDRFLATDKLYPGSSKAHAKQFTGTAALSCLVVSVPSKTTVRTFCSGALSFGSSMLLSASYQTFGPRNGLTQFPINGGTGSFDRSRGVLHVMGVPNTSDSNFVTCAG